MSDAIAVTHNAAAAQFEARTDHGVAVLKYSMRGGALDLAHTLVPHEAEGRGVGTALAHAALEHARREQVKVIASCPFVASYLTQHPEYADLVGSY